MKHGVYNIIWVDDEVDRYYEESKRLLKQSGISVIGMAHTANEFYEIIQLQYDKVDAVITDANFSCKGTDYTDTTLSGLRSIERNIKSLNDKRVIPFYLYTGRENLLEKRDEDEFLYFKETNRIFKRGNLSKLLEQLKLDVEHINSPEFIIRNKYKDELNAAKRIRDNEEDLFEILKYDFSKEIEPDKTATYFNVLRKIVERIFEQSKRRKIIAPIRSLNAWTKFLQNKDENYEIVESLEIIPIALVNSLKYLLNILQDGSHSTDSCVVDRYIRENGGINIFRSALHITMELCLWYDKYLQEHHNTQENAKSWRIRDNNEIFKYEGKIFIPEKDEDGVWHCEECLVGIKHWESGRIKLKNITDNTNSQTRSKYPYFAKFDKVD